MVFSGDEAPEFVLTPVSTDPRRCCRRRFHDLDRKSRKDPPRLRSEGGEDPS